MPEKRWIKYQRKTKQNNESDSVTNRKTTGSEFEKKNEKEMEIFT